MTSETICVAFSVLFLIALEPISVSLHSILASYPHCVPLSTRPCLTHHWVFPLTEEQPSRIYPSEIKRGNEKKKSQEERSEERLHIQAWTLVQGPRSIDFHHSLCTVSTSVLNTDKKINICFYLQWKKKTEMLLVEKEKCTCLLHFQPFSPLHASASIPFRVHISVVIQKHTNTNANTHSCMETYSSYFYLYVIGLEGLPVRCEECDRIIRSRGPFPPIIQQSGLVLIFLWKHAVGNDAENSSLPTRPYKLILVQWSVFNSLSETLLHFCVFWLQVHMTLLVLSEES